MSFLQITWGNKILSVAGHTKDPAETVTGFDLFYLHNLYLFFLFIQSHTELPCFMLSMIVKEFDPQTCTWSNLKTYGKPPVTIVWISLIDHSTCRSISK